MERIDEIGLLRIIGGEQGGDTPWNSTQPVNRLSSRGLSQLLREGRPRKFAGLKLVEDASGTCTFRRQEITVTDPIMYGCGSQWYSYVPGSVNA